MAKYEFNFDEDHGDNDGVRISAVVELEEEAETTRAHGFVHNTNADLVVEHDARFSGLCRAEVIHDVFWAMLFGRRIDGKFFDAPDLEALRAAAGLVCDCSEDDDQQEGRPVSDATASRPDYAVDRGQLRIKRWNTPDGTVVADLSSGAPRGVHLYRRLSDDQPDHARITDPLALARALRAAHDAVQRDDTEETHHDR